MRSLQLPFKYELLFCLALTIAIAAMYGQVRNYEFVFDDYIYVAENPYVLKGFTTEGLTWAFSFRNNDAAYWHPLTWLSHMADVAMFGNQAGPHHLMNILWHVLNACLLFFILHRTTRMFWFSAFAASFFAAHPLNVETVAWIAERKNLLSTFFGLLTIAAYVYYARRPNFRKYLLLVLVFVTGLLTKPMLVTLPFILLLLDYWPLNRISFQKDAPEIQQPLATRATGRPLPLLLEKIPLLCQALLITYCVTASLNENDFSRAPFTLRVENLFVSYASYLGKFILPVDLAVFYPFPQSLSVAQVAASVLLLGGVTIAVLFPLREKKQFTVGWLWFLGALTPVSGLIQTGRWPALADRWTYVPFIGLFIIVSWCIQELLKRLRHQHAWSCGVLLLILFALGTLSWRQARHWQNSAALFSHALAVTSANYLAHQNLGLALSQEGRFDEAIDHYYQSLAIQPRYEVRLNLIYLLYRQGRTEELNRVYEEGVLLHPNRFKAGRNMFNTPARQSSHGEADSTLPHYPGQSAGAGNAHFNKANELARLGRYEEAIEEYGKVIAVAPDHADALHNLAFSLARLGKNDLAISYFRRVLAVAPNNADTHYNLAWLLAREKRTEEAVSSFEQALLINPSSGEAHAGLGTLLLQQGKANEALSHFQEAVKCNPENQHFRSLLENAQ